MSNIKFLLKFGEKKYLQDLVEEKLYCSNAMSFWGIEDKLKVKEQGDRLEASTKMFGQQTIMQNPDTGEVLLCLGKSSGLVRIESAKHMPVYCLFIVYEEDCEKDCDGNYIISLSDEKNELSGNIFLRQME